MPLMGRALAVSLQLVAVSVCGAGDVRAPQAKGLSLCSVSNGNPCVHSCASGTYDLSAFAPTAAQGKPYWQVTDAESHAYFFMACGAVTAVTCQGSSTQAPVAIQTFSSPAPPSPFPSDSCVGLGDVSTASCHTGNGTSLMCDYGQGDGSRTVSFEYACAPTMSTPTASQPDQSSDPPHYVIKFAGPGGCPGGGAAGGTSWGTLFLILFPVTVGLYFGGGYAYNYKVRELRGVEAIPQKEQWKQLPGLVKDGCQFSYKKTKQFVEYLQEKQRGGVDPGLKRALAENEDGGASATAYEEQRA